MGKLVEKLIEEMQNIKSEIDDLRIKLAKG